MTAEVSNTNRDFQQDLIPFIEDHFTEVAIAVSTLVLFVLQPFSLFFGLFFGFLGHYHFDPDAVLIKDGIATNGHTTLAIIAAVAAILRIVPGGSTGGYIFESIPPLFSMALGSCLFLAFRSCHKVFSVNI